MRIKAFASIFFLFSILLSTVNGEELHEILPTKPNLDTEKLQNILSTVDSLTPKNIEASLHLNRKRARVEILPAWYVNFLPFGEYYIEWIKKRHEEKVAIIRNGSLTINELFHILKRKRLAYRKGRVLVFKVPVYISPGASLTVKGVKWGLGAPVITSGLLYINNSQVFPWDLKKNCISVIPKLTYKDYYLVGRMSPRPYIKTLKGGKLIILNSKFKYLGFRGLSSSYGISVVGWPFRKKFVETPVLYLLYSDKWHHNFGLTRLAKDLKKDKTIGIIVGSDFIENFMGFFSNEADNVFLIGNIYRNNYQYNIDPHDWTKSIIVSYNWVEGAHKAHGIIYSRFVSGAVIENVSINNHGAGIMMDRCSNSFVHRNLTMNNDLGGISLLESDNNILTNNIVMRNHNYGVFARNSLNTYLNSNSIVHNIGFGEEVAIADLSKFTYRNFIIDKYHMASSSWNESNVFIENLNGEAKSIRGAFGFYKNQFKYLYPSFLLGDLAPYTMEVVRKQDKEPVIIPGKGNPEWIGVNLPDVRKSILKLEKYLWRRGNDTAATDYSLYLLWNQFENINKFLKGYNVPYSFKKGFKLLVKRASEGDRKALTFLGILLLSYAPNSYNSEALIMTSEGALLGSPSAQYILTVLPIISNISERKIESSIQKAVKRIESGRLVKCKLLRLSPSVCSYPENLHLLRETEREILREKSARNYNSFSQFFKNKVSLMQKRILEKRISSMKDQIKERNSKFYYFFSHEKELKINNPLYINPEIILSFKKEAKKRAKVSFQKLFLKKHKERDMELIRPWINDFVYKFNRYREDKLTPEKALKLIEEKCFNVR